MPLYNDLGTRGRPRHTLLLLAEAPVLEGLARVTIPEQITAEQVLAYVELLRVVAQRGQLLLLLPSRSKHSPEHTCKTHNFFCLLLSNFYKIHATSNLVLFIKEKKKKKYTYHYLVFNNSLYT
jgi:hypothetical protein